MAAVKCSQCERPAIGTASGLPLCVDCYFKLQQANRMQEASFANYMNFLLGEMEAVGGLYGIFPRYEVPQPIVHQGQMNIQNIKVDKSNVGVINTGEIGRIEMARSVISKTGNSELTEAIREFTEAIIAIKEADKDIKNEIIEKVAFLSAQAAFPKEKRKPSIVKIVIESIKKTLTSTAALTTLVTSFDKLVALFDKIF